MSSSVVVTGAAGLVGGVLMRGLDPRYDVRGVDRHRAGRADGGRVIRRGDLRRSRIARRSLAGADTVIHLAAARSGDSSWRTVHEVNMRLTWEVLEAARAAGVSRVVLASSNHVVGGYEADEPYRTILAGRREVDPLTVLRLGSDATVRPDGPYAVGKVMDEAAGRHVAEVGGPSVIALRIGTVRPGNRPETARHLSTLLTHRDLVHLVECCIEASPALRFATFYGVSANTWRIWDIDEPGDAIGYSPVDDAERARDTVMGT